MKINYILSDTTKNATTSTLMQVIKQAEANVFEDFVVIVPETKSIIIEKELLELSTKKAFSNIFVYSFVRLIHRLGFVSSEKIVTKQTCVLLLRKIIYDNIDSLKCYKKTAKTIGFAEKMYETIAQFKSSNITVDELRLSLETKSESLKAKLEDILFLYEKYEEALGGEIYDDLDRLKLISSFAKSSDFIKNAKVFVVGFDNITYEMVSVLKDLAINAKEITFSSVYFNEKREDKHIQSNDLYLKFKRVADELKYPYVPVFFKTKKGGDFYAVQNYLFANKSYKVKPQGEVEIFEASSKKQEIEAVANKILNRVKQGRRFKDVGLFVCDLDTSAELIKECFDEYEIPYFINQAYDVSNHFFVKFIMNAFDLVQFRCASEKVLTFVSNPIWSSDDFSLLFKYLQETGASYESIFEYREKNDYTKEFENQIKDILLKLKKFYDEFKIIVSKCNTFSDYCKAIKFVCDYFDIKSSLESIAKSQEEHGFVVESEITKQVFEKYQRFNDSAENFMGLLKLSLDEFVQIYYTGFSSLKLNLSPVSIDCVIVQNNTDGFFGIKDMFIVGAEEGKFPVKIDDSGIILDRELEETIDNIKMPIEPTVKEINKRENYRAYEALLEPSENLFVSYSTASFDGKSSKPARIILRLMNLFGENILIKSYENAGFINYRNYAKKFARNINKYINFKDVSDAEINREYNELKGKFGERFEAFLNELSYEKPDFILKNADGLYFYGDKTSVSQIEKYFDCPYLFFATYGLRLKENKNAKISNLDVGTIIHRVAELFVDEIELFKDLTDLEFDKKVSDLISQAIQELKISENRNQAILSLIFVECKKLCKHIFIEQTNSGFKFKKSEWSFDGENAVKLKLQDGREVSIEGKIDRIDEFNNYIRIIDYKTGKVDSDFSAIYYGLKVQLISYLSAVTKYGDKKVAGVFYLPIHSDYATSEKMLKNMYKMEGFLLDDIDIVRNMDYTLGSENKESSFVPLKIKISKETESNQFFEFAGRQTKNLSETEFENVKNYTEELCTNAVQEILSGYIEPSPFSASASDGTARCAYCKLAGFCGLEKSKNKFGRVCLSKADVSSFDLKKEVQDNE